jgi:ABC-type branched-subunit amino acid transport system permease subunit
MSGSLWTAILTIAVWPAVIVVLVIIALLRAPSDQQAAVLRALAEVVRAARRTDRRP